MKRESRRGLRMLWLRTLMALAICATAVPLGAEAPSKGETSSERLYLAEELPDEATPARQGTFEVPYAVIVDLLLASLAEPDGVGWIDDWAVSLGLDSDSTLVQDLLSLALDLERQHPRGLTPEKREEALQQFAGDDKGLKLWTQERRVSRYRAAGAAFGRWLETRSTDGYPPEFLIERLLSRQASLTGQVYRNLSTHQQATLRDSRSEAEAFEEGLLTVLEDVPERFRVKTSLHY